MATDIRSKTSRARLSPKHHPYWTRLEVGGELGYRKQTSGEGVWQARWRDPVSGKRPERSLGRFEDFDQAAEAARKWFRSLDMGVTSKKVTVSEACRLYVDHNRIAKTPANASDAEGRFRRLVYSHPIGAKSLDRLTKADVTRWQVGLITEADGDDEEAVRRAKDSANRNLAALKAALNFALTQGMVSGSVAWESVKAFPRVGARRDYFLTREERRALLANCPSDFADFMTAMLMTGARPGELAKLNVDDFDRNVGTLTIPSGKTGRRLTTLSTDAVAFFKRVSGNRLGPQRLLPVAVPVVRRGNVLDDRWGKDKWKELFRAAADLSGIPLEAKLYSLRHTAISEMVLSGASVFEVAKWTGTSVKMIEDHYGHLRLESTRARLDTVRIL